MRGKPALPASVVNLFSTDAVAMLCGVGEHKMRQFIRRHAGELPEARFVPAYLVGNHGGYNKQRVFTAEDVVVIRGVLARVKAEKKAMWEARMKRRRWRWAGAGVEASRWRSRQGPLGPPAPPRADGGGAA